MKNNRRPAPEIAVVVPTVREPSILRFLREWQDLFRKNRVRLFVYEDNPVPTFDIPAARGYAMSHFTWSDVDKDLGKDAWIIPRRTSANKSYAFWKAYRSGARMIMVLDDDCYPPAGYKLGKAFAYDPIALHRDNLFAGNFQEPAWASSVRNIRPRGLPYKGTARDISDRVALSHGLWANVPDLDGRTQVKLADPRMKVRDYFRAQVVPPGAFFPMCGMNLAWKRELTPAMYFMLMGQDLRGRLWGFDRFDDIWAGIFAKKIIDALGWRAVSGHPVIWHDRASNAETNLRKERTGLPVNEMLWRAVDAVDLEPGTVAGMYKELAKKIPLEGEYWRKLKRAMRIWADLF